MTPRLHIRNLPLVALLVLAAAAPAPADTAIQWLDFDTGLAQAGRQQRKLFVTFYNARCPSCHKMKRETFADPEVIAYLNAHFAAVRVDTDRSPRLAARYRVRGVPSHAFVTPDGKTISQVMGAIPPRRFLHLLRYVGTDSYRRMPFNRFIATLQPARTP